MVVTMKEMTEMMTTMKMMTKKTSAKCRSHGDRGALRWTPPWTVVGGCVAAFVFTLIFVVSFLLAACRRRRQRIGSPGAPTRIPEAVQSQVSPDDSEGLTYAELRAVTPNTPGPSPAPEHPVIYAEVSAGGPH
ncbi:UNVERIFIED_CONTAM: hypothetical protein H355_014770 [Colinus virginianus]|nr:hypothetical protein H355_014770 [Colinus virginianus]